jgi:hypothetical protein
MKANIGNIDRAVRFIAGIALIAMAATGVIGGTPNISGTFKVILTPANANGIGAPVTIVITILPNVTFGGG